MKRGEIEEDESELFEINVNLCGGKLFTIKEEVEDRNLVDDRSLFSFDFRGEEEADIVHVAISGAGAGESNSNNNYSMEALVWTLNKIAVARPSSSRNNSVVFLVHIYPQLRFIPTPLGKFPISNANPEQKQLHLQLEMIRRQEYLQKFIDFCFSSQVKVEILSIESDSEAEALVDLIPILNMRKLVIGIPSSKNMKKTGKSRRKRNGLTDYVIKNAPEFCKVKIICGGEEIRF